MSLGLPKVLTSKGLWSAVALVLLLSGAAGVKLALSQSADTAPAASQPVAATPADALIARGKYLVTAADCMPCHTGPNHAPFSGGLVLNTPFGGMASPNITPDKTTGIGNWSDADFWGALHYGVSPGRSYLIFPKYLYPGMPFTSYTKLTYPDVMAIKAYLFSLKPVNVEPTPNTLIFPFSQRPVLLGWRILFFRSGTMQMDLSWSADVKNGAYLTEALGHCGECHTPRNIMSAMIMGQSYAGAPIDAFYAPNISSDKTYGVGGWSSADLVSFLAQDDDKTRGSAFGPMGEVVQYSLSQIPQSDVQDIALYLQTITAPRSTPPTPDLPGAVDTADSVGAKVYASDCGGCHGMQGAGRYPIIPPLAGNGSVIATEPFNIIGAVLNGLEPWHHGPAMPSFAAGLSDEEIAAVANYVRISWGNGATANAAPSDVMALRKVSNLPPMASAMSDQFGCPRITGAGGDDSLADPGSGLLGMMTGATPQTLPNRTRALIAGLKASDSTMTSAVITNYLVAAYCPVVANQSGMSTAEKQAALQNFIAGAQPLIDAQ